MNHDQLFQEAVRRFSNLYRVPISPITNAKGKVIKKFLDLPQQDKKINLSKFLI